MGKFKWKKLSDEKKYELVHQIVTDPAQYKERLEASNFHKLLAVLQYFLGGKETQEKLIEKQLDVALSKMSIKTDEGRLFTDQLIAVFDRSKALGKDTSSLVPKFWALYEDLKAEAFAKLKSNPLNVNALSAPMKELIKYAKKLQNKLVQCHPSITEDEHRTKIVEAMKELIKHQITLIIQQAGEWRPQNLSRILLSWSGMSPKDWSAVVSSVSMLSHRKSFHENFGQQVADLDWMARNATFAKPPEYCSGCMSTICTEDFRVTRDYSPGLYGNSGGLFYAEKIEHKRPFKDYLEFEQGTYDANGVFTPANKEQYECLVHVKVPDSPSDPSHWGHLAWLFCEYMESVEAA